MKKILLLSMLPILLVGCLQKVDEANIVAKVGRKVLSVDDVMGKIDLTNPQQAEYFKKKENKVKLLDSLIDQEVIYQLAKNEGLQRNKEYRDSINDLKRDVLIQYYLKENVDKIAQVNRSEIEDFYNQNQEQFEAFEMRNLSHIQVEKKEDAFKALAMIKNGEKFEVVAKKVSVEAASKNRGGALGWRRITDFALPEFSKATFEIPKKGGITEPLASTVGFHIFKLNDVRQMPARNLDQASQEISQILINQKREQLYNDILKTGQDIVSIQRNIENL